MRTLIALLLVANLAFFAWTQGWLDGVVGVRSIGDREPERMARQVRPEGLAILAPGSAPEPAPAAPSCLEAGPFTDAELAGAQAAAETALPAGSWITTRTERAGEWIVYMGRYVSRDAQVKKEEELKRRRVPFEEVRGPAPLAPGLALGRFDQRVAAEQALERFTQQGIRTARVVELTPAEGRSLLRVDKADAALAAQLAALKSDAFGKGFGSCATVAAR
jgi:hypothetical protein